MVVITILKEMYHLNYIGNNPVEGPMIIPTAVIRCENDRTINLCRTVDSVNIGDATSRIVCLCLIGSSVQCHPRHNYARQKMSRARRTALSFPTSVYGIHPMHLFYTTKNSPT